MIRPSFMTIAKILLLLPMLILGLIVVQHQSAVSGAKLYRVNITGYDPRDLLTGHYISFRFSWNETTAPPMDGRCGDGGDCCLCLERHEGSSYPDATFKQCSASLSCAAHFPLTKPEPCLHGSGTCLHDGDAFNPLGVQRYLVSEKVAERLTRLLQQANTHVSIGLAATARGGFVLGPIYIDDVEWQTYAAAHPDVFKH